VLYNASIGPYVKTLGTHLPQYAHLVPPLADLRTSVAQLEKTTVLPPSSQLPRATGGM